MSFKRYLILVSVGVLCGFLGVFAIKKINTLFDFDSSKKVARHEIIVQAQAFANKLGIDYQRASIFVKQVDLSRVFFALVNQYGYKKLAKLMDQHKYNLQQYEVCYSSLPVIATSAACLTFDDTGRFVGFEMSLRAALLLQADPFSNQLQVAQEVVSEFVKDFNSDYKFAFKNQTTKKYDNSDDLLDFFERKKHPYTQFLKAPERIHEDQYYYNAQNDLYIVVSFINGIFTGFKYELPIAKDSVEKTDNASRTTKMIGGFFSILSGILLLIIIFGLRKQINNRDKSTASRIALVLSVLLVLNSIMYYLSKIPASATRDTYLLVGILCCLFCIAALINYKVAKYFIGFAQGIEKQVRPNGISMADNLSISIAATPEKIANTVIAYVVIPIKLAFAVVLMYLMVLSDWNISAFGDEYVNTFIEPVFISLFAGVTEEVLFRGILFGGMLWIMQKTKKSSALTICLALVLQALLFAGAHNFGINDPSFAHMLVLFPAALILGALYYYYGLYTAILTHSFYDLLLFNSSQSNHFLTHVVSVLIALLPLVLLYAAYKKKGSHDLTI